MIVSMSGPTARRVHPGLAERDEAALLRCQIAEDVREVAGRARQPVELGDHDDLTGQQVAMSFWKRLRVD